MIRNETYAKAPFADLVCEVTLTSSIMSSSELSEARKSILDLFHSSLPDYKTELTESTISLKTLDNGLLLATNRFKSESNLLPLKAVEGVTDTTVAG